jgi:hypothetical protein
MNQLDKSTTIHTFRVEGIDIPVDEDNIYNLELNQCRRFHNIIVTRTNYIVDLKKYANITSFEYQVEKHTLDILIRKYEQALISLKAKEKQQKKRIQEQKLQKAKDDYAITGKCTNCFVSKYREKIGFCLYQCKICGEKDDTSNDSGYM